MTGKPAQVSATAVIARLEEQVGHSMCATIEISDHCNEVCVHCYQVQGQKKEMSTEEVCRAIDGLADAGILLLTLSGGEVLLRSDFLPIARHARARGFLLRVFTNGLLLDEKMAKAMGELAIETVEISVYSHRAEVHDFITGVPGSLERTVAGIRRLVAEGVAVVAKTPVMSVNEDHIDEYSQMVASLGAKLRLSPGELMPREGGTGEPWALNPSPVAAKRLKTAYLNERPRSGSRRPVDSLSCGAGRQVHIEADGQLRPCSILELDLGNITEADLATSRAQSETLKGLLEIRFGDLHGCRDCQISGHCGRCYASALAETGDALGPQPSACRAARAGYESQHGVGLKIENVATAGETGPFELLSSDRCRVIPDAISAQDEQFASRLGWVRRAPSDVSVVPARPGELIQLRRPGQKRPIKQRVPSDVLGEAGSGALGVNEGAAQKISHKISHKNSQ